MAESGYVGLVSGACLSEFGHQVICVDKDAGKVSSLQSGVIPIFEPGLDEIVTANVKAGRVMFELSGVDEVTAREAMRRAMHKLPMKCRFVSREAGEF